MPEISDGEYRDFLLYQQLGTPREITKKIGDLEDDNRDQREELRTVKAQYPEGTVAVPKADADRLEQYKALGKPDEIKSKIEAGDKAQQNLATMTRTQQAGDFAAVAGLAKEAVETLIALPALAEAQFTVEVEKTKDDAGKDVEKKKAFIVVGDKKLTFAAAQDEFPALKGLRPAAETPSTHGEPQPFVQLGDGAGGGSGAGGNVFDKIREMRKKQGEEGGKAPTAADLEGRLGMTRPA